MFIGYLEGKLLASDAAGATVVAGGVGYELRLPAPTLEGLGPAGGQVALWVHTAVKEDAVELFGFASERERALFRLLVGVPKVGPAMALLLMSSLAAGELAAAVRQGDLARLTRVKGIGKKTAETLLFHLKDHALEIAAAAADFPAGPRPGPAAPAPPSDELVAALLALGYRPAQAETAAARARERIGGTDLALLVREALQVIRVS
ncbi:MAG TPA: Holliday junction branch migration protein RuvA [Myxococcales bacterium]|nr:Holliday junction branch migration protein RuvA [Myxococcales bacterium]